jgi:hypothetical protein
MYVWQPSVASVIYNINRFSAFRTHGMLFAQRPYPCSWKICIYASCSFRVWMGRRPRRRNGSQSGIFFFGSTLLCDLLELPLVRSRTSNWLWTYHPQYMGTFYYSTRNLIMLDFHGFDRPIFLEGLGCLCLQLTRTARLLMRMSLSPNAPPENHISGFPEPLRWQ